MTFSQKLDKLEEYILKINQEKLKLNHENNRLDELLNSKKNEIQEMKGLMMRVGHELEGQVNTSNTHHTTIKVDRTSFKSKSEDRNNRSN